jgi:copper homeostasis protein CutC
LSSKEAGKRMEIRMEKAAKPLAGVAEVVAGLQRQLPTQQSKWIEQLRQSPGKFAELEVTVHHAFQQMADQVMAGLLAEVSKPADWAQDAKKK